MMVKKHDNNDGRNTVKEDNINMKTASISDNDTHNTTGVKMGKFK